MPCDDEQHVLLTRPHEPCDFFLLFVPRDHLARIGRCEGIEHAIDPRRLLLPDDAVLRRSMLTLSGRRSSPGEDVGRTDEAARRLVLRLVELSGGGVPDWRDDASVFDPLTIRHLVEHIDAHLRTDPSLGDMGVRVGLSPSHFAKKFRRSTGLSLHRFVNRRRIRASLEALKDQSQPLANVALELGFSSQAHFTHLFGTLTGMTPAKYRKQFRRTVG